MPEHGVWCELAVAEAGERSPSYATLASQNTSPALRSVLAGLGAEPALEDLGVADASATGSRHQLQESSIARHAVHACASAAVVVDCCSGRGALSERVRDAVEAAAGSAPPGAAPRHVLLDRAAFKGRRCSAKRLRSRGARAARVVADGGAVRFEEYAKEDGDGARPGIVAVAKHACGPATDLILRAAAAAAARGAPPRTSVFVATCCHHRCTWRDYAGRAYFERLGLGRRDFDHAVRMSGWATLDEADGHGAPPPRAGPGSRDEMKAIGARCKRLLDLGRVDYLAADRAFAAARLVRYTRASVESNLIAASAAT